MWHPMIHPTVSASLTRMADQVSKGVVTKARLDRKCVAKEHGRSRGRELLHPSAQACVTSRRARTSLATDRCFLLGT